MNIQRSLSGCIEALQSHAAQMGGVFSTADLANLIGRRSPLAAARMFRRLCREGILQRVQRGLYVTRSYDAWVLAARFFPEGSISLDSALAHHGLIGPVPTGCVALVGARRSRRIVIGETVLQLYALAPALRFGGIRNAKGYVLADPEKAFLDLLYFYTKGHRFVIDPRHEVRVERLDHRKVLRYLRTYRNPKFIRFVKGVLDGT